jgi:CRP-like cAMP-binding protein
VQPKANKAILDSLLSNPFFADLEPEMVAELAACGEMRDFAVGEEILREGETGDAAYVVDAGRVTIGMRVRGSQVEVAQREAGAFLGEISLVSEVPHTATVAAKTAVRALRISRADFTSVMSTDHEVLLAIIRALGRRLYKATVPLAYLSFTASALGPSSRTSRSVRTRSGASPASSSPWRDTSPSARDGWKRPSRSGPTTSTRRSRAARSSRTSCGRWPASMD